MDREPTFGRPQDSIIRLMTDRFRRELVQLAPVAPDQVRSDTRFDASIPRRMRRRVWRELARRGFALPPLVLSPSVAGFILFSALARSAMLAWLLNNVVFMWAILPFALLSYFLTRPFAVHPQPGCETVREAVFYVTPFRRADYEAGLWPREDLAIKVRSIIADALGLPLVNVREESRLVELGC